VKQIADALKAAEAYRKAVSALRGSVSRYMEAELRELEGLDETFVETFGRGGTGLERLRKQIDAHAQLLAAIAWDYFGVTLPRPSHHPKEWPRFNLGMMLAVIFEEATGKIPRRSSHFQAFVDAAIVRRIRKHVLGGVVDSLVTDVVAWRKREEWTSGSRINLIEVIQKRLGIKKSSRGSSAPFERRLLPGEKPL
jgi:hypothetical protein